MRNPRQINDTRGDLRSLAAVLAIAFAIALSLAPAPERNPSPIGAVSAYADCDTCGTAGHDPTGPGRP